MTELNELIEFIEGWKNVALQWESPITAGLFEEAAEQLYRLKDLEN